MKKWYPSKSRFEACGFKKAGEIDKDLIEVFISELEKKFTKNSDFDKSELIDSIHELVYNKTLYKLTKSSDVNTPSELQIYFCDTEICISSFVFINPNDTAEENKEFYESNKIEIKLFRRGARVVSKLCSTEY